jgi:hypothetical protein
LRSRRSTLRSNLSIIPKFLHVPRIAAGHLCRSPRSIIEGGEDFNEYIHVRRNQLAETHRRAAIVIDTSSRSRSLREILQPSKDARLFMAFDMRQAVIRLTALFGREVLTFDAVSASKK